MILTICVALLALVLVVLPWWRDPETKRLNSPDEKEFPGSYVRLSHGHTRYILRGPETAETVVLVGGLTTSLEFFDDLADVLNKAGYRTLQYDLYGRGGTARPRNVAYDRQTFVLQIKELLDALKIDGKVHIVGQSLGGGISSTFSADYPDRVKSLSIHASAGYLPSLPPLAKVIDTPMLGDYVWWWIGNGFVDGNLAKYFPDPSRYDPEIQALKSQFEQAEKFKGYRRSILQTIRNFKAHDMQADFSRIDADQIHMQIIWGKADIVIPVGGAQMLKSWVKGTPKLELLEGIGHMPLTQEPDLIAQLVLKHIQDS